MSEEYKLEIINPEQSFLVKEDVVEVVAPAFEGEMGILKDHIPIISFLKPGILKVISKSSDGMIEAVKHETLPWFAVQWHPERTSEGLGRALPREWLRKELQRCTNK